MTTIGKQRLGRVFLHLGIIGRWPALWATIVATTIGAFAVAGAADGPARIYSVKDRFENVKDDVNDAIVKRGLVIDYTAQIGSMLARTAKDVGASRTVYANAQAVQFCSSTLSRRVMEADPRNIAFCPHVIFVYSLPDSPETTYVGFRPLSRVGSKQQQAAIDKVNELLDAIVREATGRKK